MKRDPGFYWVLVSLVDKLEWTIGRYWRTGNWSVSGDNDLQSDNDFVEIDEHKIERQ